MKTLQDVMKREVEALPPDLSLRLAAEVMRRLDVRALPVCEGRTLVGLVTDRDIVVRGLALGRNPDSVQVSAVMTDEIERVSQSTQIDDAADLMEDHHLQRLLVVDEQERLVGLVSADELLSAQPPTRRLH